MAGIIGRRRVKNGRSRKLSGQARPQERPTPIRAVSAAVNASVLTVTFDKPVTLRGVPKYATDVAGAEPVSAALVSPLAVAVTFDAAVAAATGVTIPFEDPAVRNASGGYVMAASLTLP